MLPNSLKRLLMLLFYVTSLKKKGYKPISRERKEAGPHTSVTEPFLTKLKGNGFLWIIFWYVWKRFVKQWRRNL